MKNNTEYLASCPGCATNEIKILKPAEEHKIFITGAKEMVVKIGLCGCEQCGLTFLNPRLEQSTLHEYYSQQSRIPRDKVDEEEPFVSLMELQIEFIEKYKRLQNDMNVLEIGCAEGFFLQRLAEKSENHINLYGVELSEKYIAQATRNIPAAIIFETSLEETDFEDIKYDLVILRHVFEHLSDPVDALKIIRSILAPEGILYIEVPDYENIEPSISIFYHHEHLLYFTDKVLNSYLRSNAFNPLICENHNENPIGSGFSYPVLRSISSTSKATSLEFLPGYAEKIFSYNMNRNDNYLQSVLAQIKNSLRELNDGHSIIGLFGAGPHTMDLLALLEEENILWNKIFDNNPDKHGKYMNGIPIVNPNEENILSVDCILFSSAEFEKEMVEQVRSLVGSQVKTITIYNEYSGD